MRKYLWAALAAAVSKKDRLRGRRVGLILTGGNIDIDVFQQWAGTDATVAPGATGVTSPPSSTAASRGATTVVPAFCNFAISSGWKWSWWACVTSAERSAPTLK